MRRLVYPPTPPSIASRPPAKCIEGGSNSTVNGVVRAEQQQPPFTDIITNLCAVGKYFDETFLPRERLFESFQCMTDIHYFGPSQNRADSVRRLWTERNGNCAQWYLS